MDGIEGTARTRDGLMLRTIRWPVDGEPWAHLLLVHGLGEHAGRYRHVGERLSAAGIDTHAFDLRGFGGSAGRRAFVERWSQLHDDVEDRLADVRALAEGMPVVLYGHSMGGILALGHVLERVGRRHPDALVLSAPQLADTAPAWQHALAPFLGAATPRLRFANGIPPEALARDAVVGDAYRSDPLNVHRTTSRFGAELFAAQERTRDALVAGADVPVPTYVVHGGDDPLVPASSTAVLEGRPNVTRRVYPGLRHETHNEPEWPSVVDDTIAWLRSALGANGSPV